MVSEWSPRQLGDVLSFANGKTSPERTDGGTFSVFGSNGSIGKSDFKNSPENTIVIGRVGSYCGSTFFSNSKCWVTDNAIRANAKAENDATFAYYLLQTLNLNARRSGSGQPLLNQSILSTIDVVIPPPAEQRAIAHILGTLDDKIEINRKQNETLEAMARALFKAWFVDFEPVRAKQEGRWLRGQSLPGLPAHLYDLFPDRLVESELGEIPEGWNIQNVEDIGTIICGKTPSTKVSEFYGNDVPFITIPEMHGKIFAMDIEKRISRAGASSQQNKMLPQGAICVSCIATLGLVVITTEPSQTNQQINSVIPSEKDTTYYWYWVLRNLGNEIKAGGSGGTVLANLNTGHFSKLKVIASPRKLRFEYSNKVEALFSKIIECTRESRSLAQLRDTLLPQLISGELRVPDAQRILEAAA